MFYRIKGAYWCNDCKAEYSTKYRHFQREEIFDHYGRICVCCGSIENLTIDHINGFNYPKGVKRGNLISKELARILREKPTDIQILCRPCNASKGQSGKCNLEHVNELVDRVLSVVLYYIVVVGRTPTRK